MLCSNNLCIVPNHCIKNINFMSFFFISFHFFIINVNLMWVFVTVFDLFSVLRKEIFTKLKVKITTLKALIKTKLIN